MTKPTASAGRVPARASRRNRRSAPTPSQAPGKPTRNSAESPIAWLFSRRDSNGNPLITEVQFKAGERLREDFWFAEMSPNITQSWSFSGASTSSKRGVPGAGVDISDRVIEAADRVRRALTAVGPELAGILIDVCCYLKGLEDAERKAGWPQRSGKIVLGVALSALARHYGFAANASAPSRVARVRHWGTGDFRPTMNPPSDIGAGSDERSD